MIILTSFHYKPKKMYNTFSKTLFKKVIITNGNA